ncbi:MAG: nucleoside triphosphate pyrophosphohydrolase [Treponema sp.]|jgi:tetrapyrrole methylase family protein/MazG family protein|nr:nucleoside triphosphate pyrophosphohydrolase [Treponema sp.]
MAGNIPSNEAGPFKKLYEIVARLRDTGGCPWDREQTPLSLRSDLIEETYECIEAINEQDPAHIKEELGDIFLLATMIAYMHEQEGHFSVADALEGISEKLIRRHPHVYGEPDAAGISSEEAVRNWAKIKVEQEGRKPKDSVLDEVQRGLPPLDRAWKLQKKAARAGFGWPDAAGVIGKIEEELAVIAEAAKAGKSPLEEELGNLLFSVVNLCKVFNIEPSLALQRANIKFTERFKDEEKRMKGS